MKQVIINADDFGLSRSINAGIIKAFRDGILTSTTMLVNMPGFPDGVALAKKYPGLGVGVHLNILRGEPISPAEKIPTLVNHSGRFLQNARKVLVRLLSGQISEGDLEKELNAQVERVVDAGIRPTHFDSEKHLHVCPAMLKVLIKLAQRYQIPKIRWINERAFTFRDLARAQFYKMFFLLSLSRFSSPLIRDAGILSADFFIGVLDSGRMDALRYTRIFKNLKDGVTEIMCHPGYVDGELKSLSKDIGQTYMNSSRERELEGLLDPSLFHLSQQLGVEFIHYGALTVETYE